jgi:hypothetical protein
MPKRQAVLFTLQVLLEDAARLIEVALLSVDDEDVLAGVGRDLVDVLNDVAVFT